MAEKKAKSKYPMEVTLKFDKANIEWLRRKFEIETKDDLCDAIIECISTYMEM